MSIVVSKGQEEILYSFSKSISSVDDVTTEYTLTDANGETLGTWTVAAGESETISVSGIKTENGTLRFRTIPPSTPSTPSSSSSSSDSSSGGGETVTPVAPRTGAEGVTFTKQ